MSPDPAKPRRSTEKKGRPTPKRRDAERRPAAPTAPPKTQREAAKAARDRAKVAREQAKAGVRSGDDRYLTGRDAGPVRGYVRDIVDSRRNVGIIFLPAALIVFVGQFAGNDRATSIIFALWLASLLVLIGDSIRLGREILTRVRARFPDNTERSRSLIFYGVTRSTVLRRFRAPAARVRTGEQID